MKDGECDFDSKFLVRERFIGREYPRDGVGSRTFVCGGVWRR